MSGRKKRVEGKAELLFAMHVEIGSSRTLPKLQARLRELDVDISLSTLKRYSSRFGWHERALAHDAEAAQRRRSAGLTAQVAMLDRHAGIARAVLGAGGSALQQLLAQPDRIADMTPAEIARLVDLGMRSEKQATASASDYREAARAAWNDVIVTVADLFIEANAIEDAVERAARFARGLDLLASERLAAVEEEAPDGTAA